jgi:putative Holliday junction resolvase
MTLEVSDQDVVNRLVSEIGRLAAEDEGVETVVVGVPVRLDGSPGSETAWVERVIREVGARVAIPLMRVDERLTSHEAEGRLALTEKNWKKRKGRLDAAAAAVILQDFLDNVERLDRT